MKWLHCNPNKIFFETSSKCYKKHENKVENIKESLLGIKHVICPLSVPAENQTLQKIAVSITSTEKICRIENRLTIKNMQHTI